VADAEASRPLIVSVIGTRPEAIKMLPVVRALAGRSSIQQHVILTGQHQQLGLGLDAISVSFRDLGVDPSEQTPGEICEGIHHALCQRLSRDRPALVLVQGDTSSALAGAMAARDCGIPVAHVEAGLRSFDLDDPWPEERNRILIDRLSDLLFAPTEAAAANLNAEHLHGSILVTGNSGIDALFQARADPFSDAITLAPDRRTILVTCHRRENRDRRLNHIARALRRLVDELPVQIVFPLHPNRHVRAAIEAKLSGTHHIHLLPPVDHRQMVALLDRSWLVLTDSGGLQEEAPALGRPVLVLRDVTERVEAADSSQLVGTDPDRIVAAVADLLADEARYDNMARPNFAYGDGHAADRIADAIERFLLSGQAVDKAQAQIVDR
jgi:UDP-N-acetylglucosamine 2-epimerase (non-hydrolysing)